MDFEKLYQRLSDIKRDSFYEIASDFCAALFYNIPAEERPPCVAAFLTIESWFAMSLRSGVWTFYEAWNPKEIKVTLQYLEQSANENLASIFAYGIHDYQNAKYAKNYDYPDVWIGESDKIDSWIMEHEFWLYQWETNLLLDNKTLICSFQISYP